VYLNAPKNVMDGRIKRHPQFMSNTRDNIRKIVCNVGTRSRNHYRRGRAVSIAYSECVSVGLDIQHVQRMCHIILLSVASLAVPYFNT
jgi:ribosomal protein L13E